MAAHPNNIRKVMHQRDMNQSELARLVGRSRSHLNQVINGHVPAGRELMYKLAEVLECGLDDLFLPESLDSNKHQNSA